MIDQKQLYLIFEYLDKDLRAYMEGLGSRQMEPLKVKKFLYQMLAGIADCHMKRIIHRDLKPANILLDTNGTAPPTQTTSRSRTSDSPGPTPSPCVPTPRKWSRSGTARPRSCWGRWTTARPSTSGPSAASSRKW